jgi:hypothetical protein
MSELIDAEIKENNIPSEAKLSVYKNNVEANAINALKINYPYLQKLVGDEFFDTAAIKYISHKLPENSSPYSDKDPVSGNL